MSGRKPRLLIVATHPIQYQVPLFRRLTQSDVIDLKVVFLTDFGVSPSFDPGFERELSFDVPLTEGYEHEFLTTGCRESPTWRSTPSLRRLSQLVHRDICDVVLPPGYGVLAEWPICLLARGRDIPYLTRADSRVETDRRRPKGRRLAKGLVLGRLLRGSACCLAIGASNFEFYRAYGVPLDRIIFAPFSVDNEFFALQGQRGREARQEMLGSLGLDSGLPTICFAGKLQPYKRPLDAIAAFRRMTTPANLIIIGDGPLRPVVEGAIAQEPRARFLGFINQSRIGEWFGACDVLVLPSESESWGLVVNEAMAAGSIPVVSSEVGCAPDLVRPGTGKAYPVGDVAALAAALDETTQSPGGVSKSRQKVIDLIGCYSIDETARGYELAVRTAMDLK